MTVSGANDAPTWGSVNGYNALTGGLQTPFMSNVVALNEANQPEMVNVHNGMTSNYSAVGTEFKFDLGNDWTLTGRSRFAGVNGRFVAPFPASFGTTEAIASGLAGDGNTYTLANQDGSAYEGQTLMVMHLFNTKLNNFNNFTNDYNVNKNTGFGNLNFGLYQATQQLNMSWLWNSYLMTAADAQNGYGQLIDINRVDSTGAATALTENGLLAYGVPAWGNCCQRNYNVAYNILAPYLNSDIEVTDALTLSLGARYDMGSANGTYAGSVQSPMNDINGNGTVSEVENSVSMIDNNNASVVNYNWNYLSYSVGANYQLDKNTAVFGRYSKGGRAGADRVLFGTYLNPQGGLTAANNVVDFTSQAELGYKMRKNGVLLNATAFFAQTDEKNYEATSQKFFDRTYNAMGLELEAGYTVKNFQIYGNFTYTKATIAADEVTPSNVGKTPRRQAPVIYTLTPVYNISKDLQIGANVIGTAKSFAQDNNELVMSGYFYLNPYISWSPIENFSVMLQSNNVLNAMGVTESEEGSIVAGQTNYVRARSIAGRSTAISIRYRF
jgi:outer membrane receptor protein involved in Fe transport